MREQESRRGEGGWGGRIDRCWVSAIVTTEICQITLVQSRSNTKPPPQSWYRAEALVRALYHSWMCRLCAVRGHDAVLQSYGVIQWRYL